MNSHPQVALDRVLAAEASADFPPAASCPILAATKARAKVLKKWRKQERLRFFSGLCASFHALGFSF